MKVTERKPLILSYEPHLNSPRLILAWERIGYVGIRSISYLKDKLAAREFGILEPCNFYNMEIPVKEGIIELPESRQGKFYYWENTNGADLIFYAGGREPPKKRYEYASLILEAAERLGVRELYTVCAIASPGFKKDDPKVYGVVNDASLNHTLEEYQVIPLESVGLTRVSFYENRGALKVVQYPMPEKKMSLTSMNALLLSLAKERKLPGVYLLAEISPYALNISNPGSSRAVLQVLTNMLNITLDLTGMSS